MNRETSGRYKRGREGTKVLVYIYIYIFDKLIIKKNILHKFVKSVHGNRSYIHTYRQTKLSRSSTSMAIFVM